jgi:tetratricopeptide (TPR) repeat protein
MHRWDLFVSVVCISICLFQPVAADDYVTCHSGSGDEAILACTRAISSGLLTDRDLARAFYNRANAHDNRGDFDEALADFDHAIRIDPNFVLGFNDRGYLYLAKGNVDRAITDFDEAIRLDPKFAKSYAHRGTAYLAKGDYPRAIADLDEAIRLDPKYGHGYSLRGDYYLTRGDYLHAIADYQLALGINPDHAGAAKGLNEAKAALAAAGTKPAPGTASKSALLAEKRVALVIGNSTYRFVPKLLNPSNDAKLMAETLRGLGFDLVGGGAQLDLEKPGFDQAVENFGNKLQGADVGLFYYAGHGIQVAGSNYLVPIGANLTKEADIDFQMVDTKLVLHQMELARTRLNLIVLDACRNNPFSGRGLRATSGGLAQMQAPEGTLISYETQPGNVAQDGANGNSPFTKALAQIVERPGLSVLETFNQVGLAVKRATSAAQQPWMSSSPIDGTFYFAGPLEPSNVPKPEISGQSHVTPPAFDTRALELSHWETARTSNSVLVVQTYLDRYPNGLFAALARARIEELEEKAQAAKAQKQQVQDHQTLVARTGVGEETTARPPLPRATAERCATFNGGAGPDRYCASSVLGSQFGNTYGVDNLFTGDQNTAWVEGAPGQGIGEWITVEFDRKRLVRLITVHNGYQKSSDLYYKNSRVRRLRIVFSQGQTRTFALQDRFGPQTMTVEPPIAAYWVQLIIDGIFPGRKHTDTAISKLRIASERAQ